MFVIENTHHKELPAWLSNPRDKGERRSYFENAYGDQWIASVSEVLFRFSGGDIGWKTISVHNPDYAALLTELRSVKNKTKSDGLGLNSFGMDLNPPEITWLVAVIGAWAPKLL